MTPERIAQACQRMAAAIGLEPIEASESVKAAFGAANAQSFDMGRHIVWMLKQIPGLVAEERREKAMRWLGFAQGYCICMGLYSIEDMKGLNKP